MIRFLRNLFKKKYRPNTTWCIGARKGRKIWK